MRNCFIHCVAVLIYFQLAINAASAPIHEAAKLGDVALIKTQLAEGESIEAVGPTGTPLHVAVRAKQDAAVQYLLKLGANPNAQSILGTPLLLAVRKDSIGIVKALLQANADPNLGKRALPLAEAAKRGNTEITVLLLKAGADPNAPPTSDRILALHEAARRGEVEIVNALLAAGAEPNSFTTRRETAFHLALQLKQMGTASILEELTNPFLDTAITEEMVQNADAAAGRELFDDHCGASCHSAGDAVSSGGQGPHLWNIEGSKAGTADPGFGYSGFLKGSNIVWDIHVLDRFMYSWGSVIPGLQMYTYPVWELEDRARLIAFLRSLPKR